MISYKKVNFTVLIIFFITLQLHLLRNISEIYYVIFFLITLLSIPLIVVNFKNSNNSNRVESIKIFFLFVLVFNGFMFGLLGGVYESNNGFFIGFLRASFVIPFCMLVTTTPYELDTMAKLLKLTVIISVIASLTIVYQVLFGEIFWFAEASERAGVNRYASLFGSLTAYGIFVGIPIALLPLTNLSFWIKLIFYFILTLGAVLSLQKAALMNVFFATLFLIYISHFKLKQIMFTLAHIALFLIVSITVFQHEITSYLDLFFNIDGDNQSDVTLLVSLADRLSEYPLKSIDFHGFSNLFFGVGPIGASGIFGYPEIPTSHNGIVDLLLTGGVIYLIYFMSYFFIKFKVILKRINIGIELKSSNTLANKTILFCLVLYLINMTFSTLLQFTPPGAMFLMLLLFMSKDSHNAINKFQ